MNHRYRPPEPPIPDPQGYPLTHQAVEHPSRLRRLARQLGAAGWISAAAVIVIVGVAVRVVAHDNPARAAADHAAVVAKPTATPGTPVRAKSPEYSPPVPGHMSGDGMWLIGKEIKAGIYRSTAGRSCYWERLSGLSGKYVDTLDNGGYREGPQLVEIEAGDFAFTSQGCGQWVLVR